MSEPAPRLPRVPHVPEGTSAPPQPCLTRQLVGLQPAVRVDPAHHEVVREAAGGRGGARAGRRAAAAHPGRAAPAAAAAAREDQKPRLLLWLRSSRARPRATPARPWPRSRRSLPQLHSSLGAGEAAAGSRPAGPDPDPDPGPGGRARRGSVGVRGSRRRSCASELRATASGARRSAERRAGCRRAGRAGAPRTSAWSS